MTMLQNPNQYALVKVFRRFVWMIIPALLGMFLFAPTSTLAGVGEPVLVSGAQSVLVVPVRFPGTAPGKSLADILDKSKRIDRYIQVASYGKAWLETTIADWVDLPDPLSAYAVSPHNYSVDKRRVTKLVADALGVARARHDLDNFKVIWIVVGVNTNFGVGYGMIAYAINPGMLSNFYREGPELKTVHLTGGGVFSGAGVVSAENAHVGHVVHDLLHALGGSTNGLRAVPDLYDFDLQSAPPKAKPHPALYAIHVGPWDIMSQHFVELRMPPPMPSVFIRHQLGWIDDSQIATVHPGETRDITLNPLASGKGFLAIRIPLSKSRFVLIENRQVGQTDQAIPASGMLVMEIDLAGNEGAHSGRPIARVVDGNPSTPTLDDAVFTPEGGERPSYVSSGVGVNVSPLALGADGSLMIRIGPS
ncbi:hypothetical protein [Magnetovibrio sp.]|uniref:hypothetical protein n=1 Tax=Magnetovibrio sp. TaxID=2024836 RepID=UPI002F95733E